MRKQNRTTKLEIEFHEGLLKTKPDFVESLFELGKIYTDRGMIEKGLDVDLRLAQLRPDDPVVFYNLACSYSLLGRLDESLKALKRAILLGFSDFSHMAEDKDLDQLRKISQFKEFLKKVNRKLMPGNPLD